jgi:hypothetical protein
VPSAPRHHVRGCPAGPRGRHGILGGRLRLPYRRRQSRSPPRRREEGGIGRLRIGWRCRQTCNPAGKHESRDQDSDHGWSIPRRSGCVAPRQRRAASALTCHNGQKPARVGLLEPPGQIVCSESPELQECRGAVRGRCWPGAPAQHAIAPGSAVTLGRSKPIWGNRYDSAPRRASSVDIQPLRHGRR